MVNNKSIILVSLAIILFVLSVTYFAVEKTKYTEPQIHNFSENLTIYNESEQVVKQINEKYKQEPNNTYINKNDTNYNTS